MKIEALQLTGTYPIAAPAAAVWEILHDPLRLQQAMPDCERLVYLGGNQYWGVLAIHAGLVQSRYEGRVVLSDVQPGVGYHLRAEGHGADGRLAGNGRIWLESDEATTLVHYEGVIEVEGAVADVGARYLETAARAIVRQNLTGLARQLGLVETAEDTAEPQKKKHGRLVIFLSGFLFALSILLTGGTVLILRFYRLWLRHFAREVAREVVALWAERDQSSSGYWKTG